MPDWLHVALIIYGVAVSCAWYRKHVVACQNAAGCYRVQGQLSGVEDRLSRANTKIAELRAYKLMWKQHWKLSHTIAEADKHPIQLNEVPHAPYKDSE